MSLWMIFFSCTYSRPATRQATKKPTAVLERGLNNLALTGGFFVKFAMSANMVTQVTSAQVVHHQVEVLSVLKGVVHVHEEHVLQLRKDLALVDD
jgi:hypothetical protein